jgi:hypothetical protein
MPSIRFRAPLLAFVDLVTVTAMTLRQRRTRQASCQDGEGPAHSRPAMRLSVEEAYDAPPRRPTYRNVPRPLPRHP